MAIERLPKPKKGRDGKVYHYRVRFRPSGGYRGRTEYFETKPQARAWQEDERSKARKHKKGLHTIQDLKDHDARFIVRSYVVSGAVDKDDLELDDKALREKLLEESDVPPNVFDALWSFSRRRIAGTNLYDFDRDLAEKYIDDRLKEPRKIHGSTSEAQTISPTSVVWEVAKLRVVWKWARKNVPGLSSLENIWEKVLPSGIPRVIADDRELEGDELDRLIEACKGCLGKNRYYLPLGIYLAIETGMRRQEFADLLFWKDIDFKRRRITIRKSKTDNRPLEIALPFNSHFELMNLAVALKHYGRLPCKQKIAIPEEFHWPHGKVFPMSGDAFSDAFEAAARRARIPDLNVKALRQTATTLFIKADLSPEERQIMKREKPKTMDARHYQGKVSRHIHLERIQEKLDRHMLQGRTLDAISNERLESIEKAAQFALAERPDLTEEEAIKRAVSAYREEAYEALEAVSNTSPPN